MKEQYEHLHRLLADQQNFVLMSHVNTDGDALGTLVALYYFLRKKNKNVSILVPGEIPSRYEFLNTGRLINQQSVAEGKQKIMRAGAILILDVSDLQRLDVYYEAVMQSPAVKICIDHHPIVAEGMDFCLVDTKRIATAEIVYDFFRYVQAEIDHPMAEALYTAILSDSGSFRFQGTSQFTLQMAADLLGRGIEPSELYSRVYEHAEHRQLRAWGELLYSSHSDGFILWVAVTQEWLRKWGFSLDKLDGLIDIMRRDSEATVFAVFVEKDAQETIVGLRSKNGFDVGEVARLMGGGGHYHASGFTAAKTLNTVISETMELIEQKKP